MEHGAVNQQIGKFYPYRDALNAETWSILEGVKQVLDPQGVINPRSLGFD